LAPSLHRSLATRVLRTVHRAAPGLTYHRDTQLKVGVPVTVTVTAKCSLVSADSGILVLGGIMSPSSESTRRRIVRSLAGRRRWRWQWHLRFRHSPTQRERCLCRTSSRRRWTASPLVTSDVIP